MAKPQSVVYINYFSVYLKFTTINTKQLSLGVWYIYNKLKARLKLIINIPNHPTLVSLVFIVNI